jgi:hypothetical protein
VDLLKSNANDSQIALANYSHLSALFPPILTMTPKHSNRWIFGLGILATSLAQASNPGYEIASYYVGVDGMLTMPSGTYSGLANPNANRLSFLYAHSYPVSPPSGTSAASNHYHRLGAFVYTGPNLGASTATTFGNARTPEGTRPALPLTAGLGMYAGTFVSNPLPDAHPEYDYSLMEIRSVDELSAFPAGDPRNIMFLSSGVLASNAISGLATRPDGNLARYSRSLAGANIAMELVSLSPGLNVGSASAMTIATAPGDRIPLGGGSFAPMTPVFWTSLTSAPATFNATFKLVDLSGTFGESGQWTYSFQVIPEPSTWAALLGAIALIFAAWYRRAQRK